MKGWVGLAWLSGFNWSAVPICGLIAGLSGYVVHARGEQPGSIRFVGVALSLTLAAFVAARWAAVTLFSGGIPNPKGLPAVVILALSGLLVSVGLTLAANRLLAPLHKWTALVLALELLLVLPLSYATVQVFPALNGSRDEIHAIKMGYPVFWTVLLVPLALRLGLKNPPKP